MVSFAFNKWLIHLKGFTSYHKFKPAKVKIGNVPWRFPKKLLLQISMDAHLSAPQKLWAAWLCSWPRDPCNHICIVTKDFFLKTSKIENRRQKIKGQKTIVLGIWDFESPLESLMSYSMGTKASTVLLIAILVLVLLVIVQRMWFFSHKKLWLMTQVR